MFCQSAVECIVYESECSGGWCAVCSVQCAVGVGWGQVGQGHASRALLQLCTNLLSTSNTMDTLCNALQLLETPVHITQD